ncbi:MAG: Maf family protein [Pirellulales bacterium]|nr:Maf family protein [Pirellulales bacterium]
MPPAISILERYQAAAVAEAPLDKSTRLVLASSSPRRRELLTAAGYQFDVVEPHPEAECGVCSGESPPELVARLALQKARDVVRRVPRGLIVACDTVAECHGQVLGKPAHEAHARQMLQTLRGREHRVYSGLCVWRAPVSEPLVRVARTTLVMDPLSDEQIEQYLATGLWEGKAGAFGYQDGIDWVHVISGSESNVVGLPMELLAEMLAALD